MGALCVAAALVPLRIARATPGEVSFTPTGLKLSIASIRLGNSFGGTERLYQCSSKDVANCLVDLTDPGQLDAIASAAEDATIRAGTYDRVELWACFTADPYQSAPAQVRGSFTVESEATTYFTDADPSNASGLKTSGAADFTSIDNWRCSIQTVLLATPLVVSDGATAELTLVLDLALLGYSLPETSPEQQSCKAPPGGHSRGICLTNYAAAPFVGAGEPSAERFLLAHHAESEASIDDAKANGYMFVAVDPQGTPFMATTRPALTDSGAQRTGDSVLDPVYGGPSYVAATAFSSFTVEADGSVSFQTGMGGTNSAVFEGFRLQDHTGTLRTQNGSTWKYHAIPYEQ